MSGLNTHIIAILLIAVSASIVTLVSPNGEMKKYVDLIARLCVLAALAVPIVAGVTNIPHKIAEFEQVRIEENESVESEIVSLTKANIESGIAENVEAEFGLQKGSVAVSVTLDTSDYSAIDIVNIEIILPSGSDKTSVRDYVNKLFKKTTAVSVKEAGND